MNIVSELRDKVKKERLEKANMERTIRKEVSDELNDYIVDIEQSHRYYLIIFFYPVQLMNLTKTTKQALSHGFIRKKQKNKLTTFSFNYN